VKRQLLCCTTAKNNDFSSPAARLEGACGGQPRPLTEERVVRAPPCVRVPTTVGCTHAASGFTKGARVKGKGDAHLAIELFLAYFNSVGVPITWLHADNANELKGTTW